MNYISDRENFSSSVLNNGCRSMRRLSRCGNSNSNGMSISVISGINGDCLALYSARLSCPFRSSKC